MSGHRVATIARLTVAEAARRRILSVLLGLTIVSVASTTLGVERLVSLGRASPENTELEIQVGVSQILILVAFMFSFVLAMTAAFLGGAGDRRRPRDGRRPRHPGPADPPGGLRDRALDRAGRDRHRVRGRSPGLLEIAAVRLVTRLRPAPAADRRSRFLSAQAIVLLTLALLCSTRLPSIAAGAICVVVYRPRLDGRRVRGHRARSSTPGRWWPPPRRHAGCCRATASGAARSTASNRRRSFSSPGRGGPAAEANPFFAASRRRCRSSSGRWRWVVIVLALAVSRCGRRDL